MRTSLRTKCVAFSASAGLHLAALFTLGASSLWLNDLGSEPMNGAGTDRFAFVVLSTSEWTDAAHEPPVVSAGETDDVTASVTPGLSALVQQQLAEAQNDAAQQTPEEQLAALKLFAAQLTNISSERSVDEISQRLNKVLEIPPTVSDPKPSNPDASNGPAKRLEIDTAQFIDIREETKNGKVRYIALMEDAHKVREDVEVDAATGKQLIQTFALMKQFPLLESIYRKVVMGLLDKTLRPKDGTAPDENGTGKSKPAP